MAGTGVFLGDNRLERAKGLGATAVVNSTDGKAAEAVLKLTGSRGVDTAIEAVGIAATFELCQEIIAPGGTIASSWPWLITMPFPGRIEAIGLAEGTPVEKGKVVHPTEACAATGPGT